MVVEDPKTRMTSDIGETDRENEERLLKVNG